MAKIQVLDVQTANRIAAGEVVERPASVAKELLENALDAGATAVTLEIRDGGVSYLRVTDNGSGIAPEDCRVAFERHATSKIRSGDDLSRIGTLGFRGEALPSIASVSKVELTTRTKDAVSGVKLTIEGGRVTDVRDRRVPVRGDHRPGQGGDENHHPQLRQGRARLAVVGFLVGIQDQLEAGPGHERRHRGVYVPVLLRPDLL